MRRTWLVLLGAALLLGAVLQGTTAGSDDKPADGDTDHTHHGNEPNGKMEDGDKKMGERHPQKHHTWSYNIDKEQLGVDKWSSLFPDECGSTMKRQSPIDIMSSEAEFMQQLDAFDIIANSKSVGQEEDPEKDDEDDDDDDKVMDGEDDDKEGANDDGEENVKATSHEGKMSLFNNGHTAQVNVDGDVYVMGGDLGDQYKVAQFHFHWGKDGKVGSEHRINGKMFMLEMHIVTFDNERFATLGDAVGKENGIAVLGILFKGGKHNKNLNSVVNNLAKVVEPGGPENAVPIDWIDLRDVLPAKADRYYRYQGSLTTPTCAETVKWTVFADHPTICPSQMAKFYNLREGYTTNDTAVPLVNNWRNPQPLEDRVVYRSFSTQEKLVEYNVGQTRDNEGNAASRASYSLLLPLLALLGLAIRL